ncbi:KDEL motif-containing protein 1 [Bagarius yarrelli]|uniref:KDEL motif-containing protein 1 n=1 Tax=Bagarius yarrelli TaxID=175774 RepID=A0A556UZ52_BAGYA|nr:KDEL motif-containing protein 1 [Bagarius yarrelli]
MLWRPFSGCLLYCALYFGLMSEGLCSSSQPSSSKSLVWGLGLETNAVLPARFFFIQSVDKSGENFTTSPGASTFDVKITSPSEPFSRIWVQVLDRQDGSFLVRYRMYASYTDLNIQRDLSVFSKIDLERNAYEIPQRFGQRQSLCHYTIKDNQVYIKTHGEHVGFRIFMDAFLLSLTRKVKLPDVEFFVNLGDWPLEKRRTSEKFHPIFSWCGSDDTRDIVMPTYDLTESILETMGRVSLDMMSVQANTGPAWSEKNSTAFWRGRDSRRERLELVKLARANPTLIDAAFTNFFFFKHDESLYGPIVKHVSFFDFFKYKYQINVDGTVAAYRLPYLLAGGSVVLKQDSIYYEHFYSQLQPWVHYIPLKADLSDLLEKIQWAKDHDEETRKIAQAGQQFARRHLMGDSIFCYYFKLFQVLIPFGSKELVGALTLPETECVKTALVLTHGAGGDMNLKPLMSLAQAAASSGLLCLRFTCKSLNLIHRVKAYEAAVVYLISLDRFRLTKIFLGGRSMGARAAVALARHLCVKKEVEVQGLVCVSFPLHPPSQTHAHVKRSEDLIALSQIPVLFVSGTADNMCERQILERVREQMESPNSVHWVEGANHGLAVKARAEESVLDEVQQCINRLKEMKLREALQNLQELCPNPIQRNVGVDAGYCNVPSQPKLEWFCLKLLGASRLLCRNLDQCTKAFSLIRQHLYLSEFLVLNLVLASLLSRLWVFFRGILRTLVPLYQHSMDLLHAVVLCRPMAFLTDFTLPKDLAAFLGSPYSDLLQDSSTAEPRGMNTKPSLLDRIFEEGHNEQGDEEERQMMQMLANEEMTSAIDLGRTVLRHGPAFSGSSSNMDIKLILQQTSKQHTSEVVVKATSPRQQSASSLSVLQQKRMFLKKLKASASITDTAAHLEEMISWCRRRKLYQESRYLSFTLLRCQRLKTLENEGISMQKKRRRLTKGVCHVMFKEPSLARHPLFLQRRTRCCFRTRFTTLVRLFGSVKNRFGKVRSRSQIAKDLFNVKSSNVHTKRTNVPLLCEDGMSGSGVAVGPKKSKMEIETSSLKSNTAHNNEIDHIFASFGF